MQAGAGRPPVRHQVVSGVAPSKSCRFGLRFGSRQIAKHPGLTAILFPDSNTTQDRTPSWHTQSKASGSGTPSGQASGCFRSCTLQKLPIWAQIWVSSDCKTPWLDSHPVPRFQYLGGQNTFMAYKAKASGSGTPSGQASSCFRSCTLQKLPIWAQILVSSDCKTPWLDSHPVPRFQYLGGQNTFMAYTSKGK